MTLKEWVRNRWPSEAKDFTPWLQDNLHLISDCIGLELYSIGREISAAGGRADIVAYERKSRTKIVIENQLNDADARHFQQLISYGDSLDAKIIIWIAASFSSKFQRLTTDQNRKAELESSGALYWLLKLSLNDFNIDQLALYLHTGPTQLQIESVLLSVDERNAKNQLMEAFWNWYGSNRTARVYVNKREKLYVSKSINVNEAKILVTAFCATGFLRNERTRAINSYARRLYQKFPQTNAREHWNYDEVHREILEVKLSIDLSNPKNWQYVRHWFAKIVEEITMRHLYPPL